MPNAGHNAARSRWRIVLYYTLWLCFLLALMISLRSKPVEETITVDQTRTAKVPPVSSVVVSNGLPPADPDIEAAGDRVAEAVIYLKRRQFEPALNALAQARAATDRAMIRRANDTRVKNQLLASDQEIDSVKELIRKGRIGTAAKELIEVNQQLESVSY
jgi:hypothetical protein